MKLTELELAARLVDRLNSLRGTYSCFVSICMVGMNQEGVEIGFDATKIVWC